MRWIVVLGMAAWGFGPAFGADKPVLKDKERTSYALGAYMGEYWRRQGLQLGDIDPALVIDGFRSKLANSPMNLDEPAVRAAIHDLNLDLQDRFKQRQRELAEKNKREGDAFRTKNETRPGVHVLPSGLQYRVLQEGSGTSPTTNDTIVVKYRGSLIDGTPVTTPSTAADAQPPVPLDGTKGWVEALQRMKPGDKWQVVIPPALAHGENGSFPLIGPNATLIYEIELISVQRETNSRPGFSSGDILQIPSAQELKKGAQVEVIKPAQPAQIEGAK